jgi:hypothetical protein
VPATRLNLTIEAGADFDLVVVVDDDDGTGNLTPSDLTGWTARLQAREGIDDADAVIDITPTVDDDASTVTIHIPGTDTDGYDWLSAVYDMTITDGSASRRILQGAITVDPAVTRS